MEINYATLNECLKDIKCIEKRISIQEAKRTYVYMVERLIKWLFASCKLVWGFMLFIPHPGSPKPGQMICFDGSAATAASAMPCCTSCTQVGMLSMCTDKSPICSVTMLIWCFAEYRKERKVRIEENRMGRREKACEPLLGVILVIRFKENDCTIASTTLAIKT